MSQNRVNLSFSVSVDKIAEEIERLFLGIPVADLLDLHEDIMLNGYNFDEFDKHDELPVLLKNMRKFVALAGEVAIRSDEIYQMLAQYEQSKEQLKAAIVPSPPDMSPPDMSPPDMNPLVEAAEGIKNIKD